MYRISINIIWLTIVFVGSKNRYPGLFCHIWSMILQDLLDPEREWYSNHCVWKIQCCKNCLNGEFPRLAGRQNANWSFSLMEAIWMGRPSQWSLMSFIRTIINHQVLMNTTLSNLTNHALVVCALSPIFFLSWLIFRCSCCGIFSKRIYPIWTYSCACYRNG